jgi:excinuclease ABC subunit C
MLDQEFLSSIPHVPGVYLMLNKASTVLYVGKAKDLFKRLSSYLHFSGTDHSKTSVMLRQVSKIDTLMTNTEKEALILESSLIKKHRPKYNVILRDDKSYPFIKVTVQEEWPRVFMTRRKKRDGARYFGPYSSSSAMWSTLKLLFSLFPLRRCKGAKLKPRKRPCLNHQMNNCLAPCAGKADMGQYQDMVDKVIMFMEGRNKPLLKNLKKEMIRAAELEDFEKAALLRDRIGALDKTLEKQIVLSKTQKDRDVFGFYRQGVSVSVALLYVRKGILGGSRRFFIEYT